MQQYASDTDEHLAELTQKGDNAPYAELLNRYEPKLMRYALRLVKNDQVAQDVVQNTFIKAYKNLKGFDTKRQFSSWIYRITHNEAMDHLRRKKKEISGVDKAIFDNITDQTPGIEEKMLTEEVQQMVRDLIDKLPDHYQEPLILFYLEEKSYEEISDILKMPTNTVGTKINRGKKMLAEIYEHHYGKR
ncbi:hypothetical protein COY32_01625 [candidate division WWE3 bacterium CG_4_10_14_0_2_um_filter_41_14]|uniref:RNA polymerase sigma factor n=1 Tax=candidate division WWE3 bacterium CG_4_10_14_0_2_um_filter_41_14 TaxID=1975072 RepID=A0A2M7TKQ7_UNCKA|nr:MAG: hypothetical protein COY32_01625 [candidate division WWE3 bacterium CG_4_10_14_0_2_um_filter_41_14]